MRGTNERLEVFFASETTVDLQVINNRCRLKVIFAGLDHWTRPNDVDPDAAQVVDFFLDALEVADIVTVGVAESRRVQLNLFSVK